MGARSVRLPLAVLLLLAVVLLFASGDAEAIDPEAWIRCSVFLNKSLFAPVHFYIERKIYRHDTWAHQESWAAEKCDKRVTKSRSILFGS